MSGVSINYAELEQLRSLAAVFEFFKNPQKYQDLLNAVNESVVQMETAVKSYSAMKDATKIVAEAQMKANSLTSLAQEKAKEVVATVEAELQSQKNKMKELQDRSNELEVLKLAIKESEERAKIYEQKVKDYTAQLDAKLREVFKKQEQLEQREAALKVREQLFKAALEQ